ncbi:MAG TPA: hypothetical protein VF600_16850 [Abditibacteriaceae bacterium]
MQSSFCSQAIKLLLTKVSRSVLVYMLAGGCGLIPATAGAQAMNPSQTVPSQPTQLTQVTYQGRKAFRLSDGRSEAIIVPEIGRVMSYGFVGGPNLLWNAAPQSLDYGGWKNYGGDKTWPAPQSDWPVKVGRAWPPLAEWDGDPQGAETLVGGRLRTTSSVAKRLGARVVREYSFGADGDLVVAQTVEKLRGAPMMLSIWSVAQLNAPQAVFLPLNAQSAYKDNFHWISKGNMPGVATPLSPTLLQVRPTLVAPFSSGYKIGVDAPVSAIAAMFNTTAFVIRSTRPEGAYPDGAEAAGFPVELYDSGDSDQARHYVELEILSPLRLFNAGISWTHTTRWSLHPLPSADANSLAVQNLMQQFLNTPIPDEASASTQSR